MLLLGLHGDKAHVRPMRDLASRIALPRRSSVASRTASHKPAEPTGLRAPCSSTIAHSRRPTAGLHRDQAPRLRRKKSSSSFPRAIRRLNSRRPSAILRRPAGQQASRRLHILQSFGLHDLYNRANRRRLDRNNARPRSLTGCATAAHHGPPSGCSRLLLHPTRRDISARRGRRRMGPVRRCPVAI